MKLIIAGGRHLDAHKIYPLIKWWINNQPELICEIVSGKCRGVDFAGEMYGLDNWIPVKLFPYRNGLGKAGGPVRNKEMAEYAHSLLLIWDGESSGSKNMKSQMVKLNKPVYEIILKSTK